MKRRGAGEEFADVGSWVGEGNIGLLTRNMQDNKARRKSNCTFSIIARRRKRERHRKRKRT